LTAYSECLHERRGGAQQAVRTEKYKFMRNLTTGVEEFYDVTRDPGEKRNLVNDASLAKETSELRSICNRHLLPKTQYETKPHGEQERKLMEARLRDLGYI
jgi:arylsulfatase A-like enzyme